MALAQWSMDPTTVHAARVVLGVFMSICAHACPHRHTPHAAVEELHAAPIWPKEPTRWGGAGDDEGAGRDRAALLPFLLLMHARGVGERFANQAYIWYSYPGSK